VVREFEAWVASPHLLHEAFKVILQLSCGHGDVLAETLAEKDTDELVQL